MRSIAAPVGNLVKCKTLGPAPVASQVQKLSCPVCAIIPVADQQCQVENFLFDHSAQVLYNCYINSKEPLMTTADFFADFAYEHYSEFVDHELREMFQCTNPQDENFDLDVPF
jgi:hypothetical protein